MYFGDFVNGSGGRVKKQLAGPSPFWLFAKIHIALSLNKRQSVVFKRTANKFVKCFAQRSQHCLTIIVKTSLWLWYEAENL